MQHDETARNMEPCFWCDRVHRAEHSLSVCPECHERFATMRLLEMAGSYPLDAVAIDALLPRTSPGNYALGYLDGEMFRVFYVGRSDGDLRRRLQQWVGVPSRSRRYASIAKAPWGRRQRSWSVVNAPSLDTVGNVASVYTRFAFSYADSAEDAYAKQCRNYSAFGGHQELDNETRPVAS